MKKVLISSIIIAVLLISFISYFIFGFNNKNSGISGFVGKTGSNEAGSGNSNTGDSSNTDVQKGDLDYNTDSGNDFEGGGDSGGSAGSAESTGAAGTDAKDSENSSSGKNCDNKQVSYALENLGSVGTCNNFQDGICVDKTTICQIRVYNFDKEAGGNFKIKFSSFDLDNPGSEVFGSILKEDFLGPDSNKLFEGTFNIQSQNAEGNANKKIGCWFFTESVPTKEVCS